LDKSICRIHTYKYKLFIWWTDKASEKQPKEESKPYLVSRYHCRLEDVLI